MSTIENTVAFLKKSMKSSILGSEYESLKVSAFNFQWSAQKRSEPSFLRRELLEHSILSELVSSSFGQHPLDFSFFKILCFRSCTAQRGMDATFVRKLLLDAMFRKVDSSQVTVLHGL